MKFALVCEASDEQGRARRISSGVHALVSYYCGPLAENFILAWCGLVACQNTFGYTMLGIAWGDRIVVAPALTSVAGQPKPALDLSVGPGPTSVSLPP